MNVTTDIRQLQDSLEKLYNSLGHNGVYSSNSIKNDLKILLNVLQCPVFDSILNVQVSLQQLKETLKQSPNILPDDFDIDLSTLELRVNASNLNNNNGANNSGSDLENAFDYDSRTMPSKFSLQKYINESCEGVHQEPDYVNISLQDYEFRKGISELAHGRFVQTVELCKPDGQSLGFKVVGGIDTRPGIYIQEIHDNGIAAKNGLLKRDDQILAIDSHLFTSDLSQDDAIRILQSAKGTLQLVVARGDSVVGEGRDAKAKQLHQHNNIGSDFLVKRTPSDLSASSKDSTVGGGGGEMVLNSEWAQIECIEFENDGEGLGFGIVGGKSSGVIVKTLAPGGVADRDNRLQIGDHILQINGISIRGKGSEQVGQILRQSSTHLKLIVARAVDPTSDLQVILNTSTIIPTKSLHDPVELQRVIADLEQSIQELNLNQIPTNLPTSLDPNAKIYVNSYEANNNNVIETIPSLQLEDKEIPTADMHTFEVELIKDQQGLGITIAGYVCEKAEEISGIFIKSIAPDSVADRSKMIQVNDQIIEVDGRSLYRYNNMQAVDLLRSTSTKVKLKLARYMKGNKYDKINEGVISASDTNSMGTNTAAAAVGAVCMNQMNGATVIQINHSSFNPPPPATNVRSKAEAVDFWSKIVGPEYDIIVANVTKFSNDGGLGISLEGTIDIENGKQGRPRHYITSIMPEGPVGRNNILQRNDELLEVNGIRLHGLRHSDVLPLLKDLPIEVQLICARPKYTVEQSVMMIDRNANISAKPIEANDKLAVDEVITKPSVASTLDAKQFADRMVKAKSDGSLAITPPIPSGSPSANLSAELRSLSLEPLVGLAMWSSEPQLIELVKGDRGLGFAILDYQDPMNRNESVIVIRSLVPGGVAQLDGRLLPGDRLLSVNDHNLENATLEQAVQTLKGAPKGVVVVGVAKPLPLPDSGSSGGSGNPSRSASKNKDEETAEDCTYQKNTIDDYLVTQRNGKEETMVEKEMVGEGDDETTDDDGGGGHKIDAKLIATTNTSEARKLIVNLVNKSSHVECDDAFPGESISTDKKQQHQQQQQHHRLMQQIDDAHQTGDATTTTKRERQLLKETQSNESAGETTTTTTTTTATTTTTISSELPSSTSEPQASSKTSSSDTSLCTSPSLSISTSSLTSVSPKTNDEHAHQPPLSMSAVVLTITLRKSDSDYLGMSLKPLEGGGGAARGCLVKSLDANGLVYRDGRVRVGDLLVSLAGKSLCGVAKNELLTILNDCNNNTQPELNIEYVPQASASNACNEMKWSESVTGDTPLDNRVSSGGGGGGASSSSSSSSCNNNEAAAAEEDADTVTNAGIVNNKAQRLQAKPDNVDNTTTSSTSCSGDQPQPGIVPLNVSTNRLATPVSPPSLSASSSLSSNVEHIIPRKLSPTSTATSSSSSSVLLNSAFRHQWGQEITVELVRDELKGFGISIIGGKNNKLGLASLTGILIKKILPDSSAAKSEALKTGDRLLEVGGIDLRNATHDEAVEAIKNAKSPVKFVVQSLILINKDQSVARQNVLLTTSSESSLNKSKSLSDNSLANTDSTQDKVGSSISSLNAAESPAGGRNVNMPEMKTSQMLKSSSSIFECSSDVNSAAHVKLTAQEISESLPPELIEDEFGYSLKKIKKKYSDINGSTLLVDLQKGLTGLGISLAGNRDRTKMSVFICGLHPKGSAFKDGRLQIGDEILEVNGMVLYGRCHLNASAIIKGLACPSYRIIVLRRDEALEEMAVKPLTQFPVHLEDFLEEKYFKFKGVRTITVRKGSQGLGIMIIEGKHSELGRGVFVSDIQDGSPAESAGLSVGDMILCVDQTDLIGCDYETAATALKGAEGLLTLVIAKPGKSMHYDTKLSLSDDMLRSVDSSQDNLSSDHESLLSKTETSNTAAAAASSTAATQNGLKGRGNTRLGEMMLMSMTSGTPAAVSNAQQQPQQLATACNNTSTGPSESNATASMALSSLTMTNDNNDNINDNNNNNHGTLSTSTNTLGNNATTNAIHVHIAPVMPVYPAAATVSTSVLNPNQPQQAVVTMADNSTAAVVSLNATNSTITSSTSTALHPDTLAHRTDGTNNVILSPDTPFHSQAQDKTVQQQQHHGETPSIQSDLKTCQLRIGEETTIEIVRDKIGLGLSIVGGANTPQSAVIIHEVYKNGAADLDGRLKPGDQILEVNGEDLRHALHEHAIKVLRQTASIIKMKVIRRPEKHDDYETFEVKLTKKPGKGLGLSIVGKKDGHGIFISDIVKGGIADLDGHLVVGDQIIQLNNQTLDNIAQEDAAILLKTAKGTIDLKIGRYKSGNPLATDAKPEELNTDETKEVELERGADGFGFSIVGGRGSVHGDLPICIRKVSAGSPAACEGHLAEGDIILAIDDTPITDMTHDQVVDILRKVDRKVKLFVLRSP